MSASSKPFKSSATTQVHLIVLIHGLYGNPTNLGVVKEELERASRLAQEYGSDGPDKKGKGKARVRAPARADTDIDNDGEEDEDQVEAQLLPPPSPLGGSTSWHRGGRVMRTRVLVLKSFQGSRTWDGIDINAHRAAREVCDRSIARSALG